jgi:hypothetical protein
MHIVAGTFTSKQQASGALHDLERQGIPPVTMNVIEGDDRKGFEREHRTTRQAAFNGACAGAAFGIVVFGILLWIAGASLFTLRFLALYLCGIALCKIGGALIFALWNMGTSHDEARLYEEAKEKHAVIAAIEVGEPMERRVIEELKTHGARNVRTGEWQPNGWKHAHPTYPAA